MYPDIAKLVKIKKSLNLILLFMAVLLPNSVICEENRVVSLAPIATELIYALGAEDSLIGVTDLCKLEDGRKLKRLGAYSAVSLEAVYSLHPSLVLLTEGAENQANMLKALGLRVYEIKTSSLALVKKSILEVSKEISLPKLGEDLVREGEIKLAGLVREGVKSEANPKKVLILFGDEGSHFGSLSFYGIGLSTFYNDLIETIGLRNAFRQNGYNILSLEGVCSIKPDCILFVGDEGSEVELRDLRNCYKDTPIHKCPKSPFLYPGIKYPEIAESIARCKGT